MRITAILLFALLGVAAPSGAQAPVPAGELALRPGDAVLVAIKDERPVPDTIPVASDGTVMLPIVGLVPVAGRPFPDVITQIRDAYARELVDPQVQVVPLVRIAVLGAVARPGLFPVDATHTVADVIARAGGLTIDADESALRLIRGADVIELGSDPGDPRLDTPVRSGDQIVVGRESWLKRNLAVFVSASASLVTATVTALLLR